MNAPFGIMLPCGLNDAAWMARMSVRIRNQNAKTNNFTE